MMLKFVFLLLIAPAISQDGSEEAIIVNQELEYLQQVASRLDNQLEQEKEAPRVRELPSNGLSLEERYFGDQSKKSDVIDTSISAPARKKVRGVLTN